MTLLIRQFPFGLPTSLGDQFIDPASLVLGISGDALLRASDAAGRTEDANFVLVQTQCDLVARPDVQGLAKGCRDYDAAGGVDPAA